MLTMLNELNLLVIFYQSKTIAYENIEAFEKVAEAVSNKLLPGQEDIEIQTKSAILTCRRAKVAALTDHPINAGNASVNFPDLEYPEPSLFVLHQNVAATLKAEVTSYLESKYNQEGISFGIKACSLIVV